MWQGNFIDAATEDKCRVLSQSMNIMIKSMYMILSQAVFPNLPFRCLLSQTLSLHLPLLLLHFDQINSYQKICSVGSWKYLLQYIYYIYNIYSLHGSTRWHCSNLPYAPPSLPLSPPFTSCFSLPFAPLLRGLDVFTQTGPSPWISTWGCSCPHCSTRPPQSKWTVSSCLPGT